MRVRWACGMTTVPSRIDSGLTDKTLASIHNGGFEVQRLFIDGIERSDRRLDKYQMPITTRFPVIRTYGNWMLSMGELFLRNPTADRFAMFQDDFITYKNLRQYLECSPYPVKGYQNLYTFPSNQTHSPQRLGAKGVWYEARELESGTKYHGKKQQSGRGAVALIFSREAVITLLTHQHMVERALDVTFGWRRVDGGIVSAMNKAGWREYVHNPSLIQHTGVISSMGNKPHKQATSFRGQDFDALKLL